MNSLFAGKDFDTKAVKEQRPMLLLPGESSNTAKEEFLRQINDVPSCASIKAQLTQLRGDPRGEPTTPKVTTPPTATQGMAPIQAATIPLSKAPNSLEEQINIQLTARSVRACHRGTRA
jgi:hypothetical protein